MAIFRVKTVPDDQQWCCLCPKWGILVPWLVSTGIQDHWTQKYGKSWKKWRNIDISGNICGLRWTWEVLKSYPKAQFWCSLCPRRCFGICRRVSKCLLMFLSQLKGSKMASSKKCHFSAPIPYWKRPYLDLILAGISHLLFSGFNAFSWPTG